MRRSTKEDPSAWPWGTGLVLFRENADPRHRRCRIGFVAVTVTIAALLVWPLASRSARIEPSVLGLPFGMAWVIALLVLMFCACVWLYRSEPDEKHVTDNESGDA